MLSLQIGLQLLVYIVYKSVYNKSMNGKYDEVLKTQFNGTYYTEKELIYSESANVLLSPFEYKMYLEYLENEIDNGNKYIISLPLKTFIYKHIYFVMGKSLSSLIDNYLDLVLDDYIKNKGFLSFRHSTDFAKSRLYSEIEGTLNVENVPTTRRRLKELLEKDDKPKDINDIIIKNMAAAIRFVQTKPAFNKDNLFILYSILSNECLEEKNKLHEGDYYRYDTVEIGRYHGCDVNEIDECMNSLFMFVNTVLKDKSNKAMNLLLPHICHYYLLYIHPYFDYNGRTARMVSYWAYLLTGYDYFPPIISEAINQTKSKYYRAIERTRDSHNDLTYFLKYIFELSCDYLLCYMNIDLVIQNAKNNGIILTDSELNYLKKILISYQGKFTYSDFLNACGITMSKQGALKILNKFIECGALIESKTKSKSKIFDINTKVVIYKMRNFHS